MSRCLQAASSSIARDQIPRRVRGGSSGERGRKAAWIETETMTETVDDPQAKMLEALERAGAIREGDEEGRRRGEGNINMTAPALPLARTPHALAFHRLQRDFAVRLPETELAVAKFHAGSGPIGPIRNSSRRSCALDRLFYGPTNQKRSH